MVYIFFTLALFDWQVDADGSGKVSISQLEQGQRTYVEDLLTCGDRRVVTSHTKIRFYAGENKTVSFQWMYIR